MKTPLTGIAIDLYNLAVELDAAAASLRSLAIHATTGHTLTALMSAADANQERSRRLRWLSNNVRNASRAVQQEAQR